MKKRLAAALLSACLALGPCAGYAAPVYGAQQNAVQTKEQGAEGVLEVEAVSAQLFPYEGEVTVEVTGEK